MGTRKRSGSSRGSSTQRGDGAKRGAKRGAGERPAKVGGRRKPARTSSAREEKRDESLVRLNKYLADHGIASRRASDELIAAGKVTVDGQPETRLGTKVDPAAQRVEVDGYVLRPETVSPRYYLLHKPAGVVCTNEKREMRPRAIDLITDKTKGRIYTVGRLDEESTGLILLTSDGEFAQRIAHPRYGVPKTYRVRVPGRIDDDAIGRVRRGVHLSEGKTSGARVLIQRRTATSSTLLVTIREGMNREIRRVFARVGFKVLSLTRTDIGPLSVRGLKAGHWRPLSRPEVEALLTASSIEGAAVDLNSPPEAPRAPRRAKPPRTRGGRRR